MTAVDTVVSGQKTSNFSRFPRMRGMAPLCFSVKYGDKSLDLMCDTKEQFDLWYAGLQDLVAGALRATRRAAARRAPARPVIRPRGPRRRGSA